MMPHQIFYLIRRIYNSQGFKLNLKAKMSKIIKIRKVINEMKRNSCLLSMQASEVTMDSSTETEKNKTVGFHESFKLLSVADRGDKTPSSVDQDSNEEQFCDGALSNKVESGPFIREKKSQNVPAFRVMKRNRDFFNETVRNVSELMANPIGTHVRINSLRERNHKNLNTCHDSQSSEKTIFVSRHSSIDARFKLRKERSSPLKKGRKGWTSRVKKTLSPLKRLSPVTRFEISAWQTNQDIDFELN